ncbi:hypothetical protein L1049_006583 [Liquidambar formosana]|uniref:F-box domain-containing protein n=1 Tax=Liquidambar formosana TaxID=63359 RepID=A0AAP0WRK1_LIQFO
MEEQQPKKQRIIEDNNRMSQLPDNLLGIILSFLTMREAVRTSVLSTRWRYLWTTSLSNLNFDVDNMLDTKQCSVTCNNTMFSCDQLYSFRRKRMIAFLNSVHHFLLHLNSDLKVEKLKVYFSFCHDEYGSYLDQWIKFAISRGIEELDLGLLENSFFHAPGNDELYDFPCDILLCDDGTARGIRSSLKCLRLAYCNLAPSFLGLNTLTTLDLMGVNLKSDENLQCLLSNCCVLEWLGLYECKNINHLVIRHPLCHRLKYLSVCDCFNLGVIEINGIDLEKFEYNAYFTINLLFNNVPQLKTIYSDRRRVGEGMVWTLSRLPIVLPQLETLLLPCSCYLEAGIMPERLPTFPNLKNLSIIEIARFKRELLWIATLLKASPSLQILELHLCTYDDVEEPREIRKPPMFPHDHLKEVVITGMRGYLSEIEIAIYLLNNAMTLDRMEIDPR